MASITVPDELVREIDCRNEDRSSFVADAVRRELDRRRREDLRASLENPHPGIGDEGLQDWISMIPEEDVEGLVDPAGGIPIRWVPGEGWVEDRRDA